jgi:cytochrome c
MSKSGAVVAMAATMILLAACGKSGDTPSAASSSDSAATPAAAAPTPEQAKALLASLPAPYNNGDIEDGQMRFAVCSSCHTLTKGGSDMTGPNLHGVFGRQPGTEGSFNYSAPVKALGYKWDAAHIDKWVENPRGVAPGTKMSYIGLRDPQGRINLIAYLKVATSDAPK